MVAPAQSNVVAQMRAELKMIAIAAAFAWLLIAVAIYTAATPNAPTEQSHELAGR
jgi:hypothetical protein